jgi:hypothetical protein
VSKPTTDVPQSRTSSGLGIIVTALLLLALWNSLVFSSSSAWGALLVGPVLFGISLPVLSRYAKSQGDRRLFGFLVFALVLKLGGALVRYWVGFDVYEGDFDAGFYHESGALLREQFLAGIFDTGLPTLVGTRFIQFLTGIVYVIVGPSVISGFLFYSWLGFWGLFLFLRAFTMAVPEGRVKTYARFLFLLPSLVYWPSSIGKEAWMMFTLGIAAVGAAHMLSGSLLRGLVPTGLGLWLGGMVRPHISGLFAVALAGAYLLRRPRPEWRQFAPFAKGFGIVLLGLVAVFLAVQASQYLQQDVGLEGSGGVTSILEQTAERTRTGGSEFAPSILESPGRAPIAIFTVLFRPTVLEAHNTQAMVAALELTFLLLLTIVRIRWIIGAIASIRRQTYVGLALFYTGVSVLAFSSLANFGILARQRVQFLPLSLVLLAIPPRTKEDAADNHRP